MDLSLLKKLDELISRLDTWQGKLMFPPSVPEHQRFDLCAFIDSSKVALSSALDFYVFSRDRYYGEDSLNDVRRDLLLSAKLGGFELVTHSSGGNKVALGVKRRLVMTCARNRCYKGVKLKYSHMGMS